MAYKIANLPATQITQVISNVTFPAYSMLQNQTDRLRKAFLKTLETYKNTIDNETTIIFSPDNEYLEYFNAAQ